MQFCFAILGARPVSGSVSAAPWPPLLLLLLLTLCCVSS